MLGQFAYFGPGPGDSRFIIALIVIGLAVLAFEITMFISAIRNQAITDNVKAMWIIGMLLVHPFAAIAYYFTDYKK